MSKLPPRPTRMLWFEPIAALSLFAVALVVNHDTHWALWLLINLITLVGSGISYRRPILGAALTAAGLVLWIPLVPPPASISGLGVFVNVFAAFRLPHPRRFLLSGCLLTLAWISLIFLSIEVPYRWGSTLILLIPACLSIGAGAFWSQSQHRLGSVTREKERVVAQLRLELARELHDTVAQTLSSAALRANLVALEEDLTPEAHAQLESIASECSSASQDLRRLLSSLRDNPDDATALTGPLADVNSLRQTLEARADRIRRHGIDVDTSLTVKTLSPALAQTMSAVVTEVANNIIKHARPSTSCSLRLFEDDGMVVGEFMNRRRMNERVSNNGMGLLGIQERMALLSGSCEVVCTPGRWLLRTKLPQNPG